MKKILLASLLTTLLMTGCTHNHFSMDNTPASKVGTGWHCGFGYVVAGINTIDPQNEGFDKAATNRICLFYKGNSQEATLVAYDAFSGLCLLSVANKAYLPSRLTISEQSATTGQKIHTAGFPLPSLLGYSPKYLEGRVSALLRGDGKNEGSSLPVSSLSDIGRTGLLYTNNRWPIRWIMNSIPVAEGCDGAPLINDIGEVIGVMSEARITDVLPTQNASDLHSSFAVPSSQLWRLLTNSSLSITQEELSAQKEVDEQKKHIEKTPPTPDETVLLVATLTADAPEKERLAFEAFFEHLSKSFAPVIKQ